MKRLCLQFLLIILFLSSQEYQLFSEETHFLISPYHTFQSYASENPKGDMEEYSEESEESELEEESEEEGDEDFPADDSALLPSELNLSEKTCYKAKSTRGPYDIIRLSSFSISQRAPPVLFL